jgi:hypothetical protein
MLALRMGGDNNTNELEGNIPAYVTDEVNKIYIS